MLFSGVPAFAQSDAPIVSACESKTPGTAIAGCTTIINAGQEMGAYLFEAYNNRAIAELSRGLPDAAIADESQAIALNPENARVYIVRARAYGARGEAALAAADASQSIALDPSNPDAFNTRGLAEAEMGKWDQDIADQSQALALAPDDEAAYGARAQADAAEDKTNAQIADLTALVGLKPDDVPALNTLGGIYLGMDDPARALAVINAVLARDPGNIQAGVNLGVYYGETSQWQREIAQLTRMLQPFRLTPVGFLVLYDHRAEAYANAGMFDAAIQDANRAILIDPHDGFAYFQLGLAYAGKNQYQQAISAASETLALQPENAVAWNNRCWYRAHTADLAGALADCKKSLALGPADPNTLDSTGYVYLKLRDDKDSIANYSAALRGDPALASSRYGRALAEREAGKQSAAAADFAAAKAMDPNIEKDF